MNDERTCFMDNYLSISFLISSWFMPSLALFLITETNHTYYHDHHMFTKWSALQIINNNNKLITNNGGIACACYQVIYSCDTQCMRQ